MREALAADLRDLIGARLLEAASPQGTAPAPAGRGEGQHSPWPRWRELLKGCEAVLPVAPESGGELLVLTLLAGLSRTACLGSQARAVRLAGSKRATACVLARAGIPVVPTLPLWQRPWPHSRAGWVVKPDDGAGAEGTHRVQQVQQGDDPADACGEADPSLQQCAARRAGLVVQPFIDGPAGSLFAYGRGARLRLLASSTQYVEWRQGRAHLAGLGVNEVLLPWQEARALAARIAETLPGLDGFWGVDFIREADGVRVLEVNPRPTSTYPALSRSLGWNAARLLLGLPVPERSMMAGHPIRLSFE